MKPQIQKGIVCISQKGRDKGRTFVVLYQMDADFVMVTDGETRKLNHLKKKRCKHLRATNRELPGILALYEQGRLTDSDVRKQLGPLNSTTPEAAIKEGSLFGQE